MKKINFSFAFIILYLTGSSQFIVYHNNKEYQVTKTSSFKDTTGKSFAYDECLIMLTGGEYDIRPLKSENLKEGFLLTKLSKEVQLQRISQAPKPNESSAFTTGKKFSSFSGTDIAGNSFDTKEMKGKILVVNFWFTTCPPCRLERPYLNQIVNDYKSDSTIIFIAIALDNKEQLEKFLSTNPFEYSIVPDGKVITDSYKVNQFPTHVIVNKQGKVAFHTVSYNAVTGYWMRKTINEIKKSQ